MMHWLNLLLSCLYVLQGGMGAELSKGASDVSGAHWLEEEWEKGYLGVTRKLFNITQKNHRQVVAGKWETNQKNTLSRG